MWCMGNEALLRLPLLPLLPHAAPAAVAAAVVDVAAGLLGERVRAAASATDRTILRLSLLYWLPAALRKVVMKGRDLVVR